MLAGCALLAGGCAPSGSTASIEATASGPVLASRVASPRADVSPAAGPSVLLVGLGDSITTGYGASRGHSYFELLQNAAADGATVDGQAPSDLRAMFPKLRALNLAVSGSTSDSVETSQVPQLPKADAATRGVVVITTGGNDLLHDYGRGVPREFALFGATRGMAQAYVDRFEARLNRVVMVIESRFPGGCQIYLANIYDPTDGVGDIEHAPVALPPWPDGEKILQSYNAAIERVVKANPNVHLVNIRDRFKGHGIHHGSRAYWYFTNLEDPNDSGYLAIRDAFMGAIRANAR